MLQLLGGTYCTVPESQTQFQLEQGNSLVYPKIICIYMSFLQTLRLIVA